MPPKLSIQVVNGPGASKVNFQKIMEVLGILLVSEVIGENEEFQLVMAEPHVANEPLSLQIVGGTGQVLFCGKGSSEEECALSLLESIGRNFSLTRKSATIQRQEFLQPPDASPFNVASYSKILH